MISDSNTLVGLQVTPLSIQNAFETRSGSISLIPTGAYSEISIAKKLIFVSNYTSRDEVREINIGYCGKKRVMQNVYTNASFIQSRLLDFIVCLGLTCQRLWQISSASTKENCLKFDSKTHLISIAMSQRLRRSKFLARQTTMQEIYPQCIHIFPRSIYKVLSL